MKNIVFDLGGVVLDWNPRKVEANFQGNRALLRYLLDHDFFSNTGLNLIGERIRKRKLSI